MYFILVKSRSEYVVRIANSRRKYLINTSPSMNICLTYVNKSKKLIDFYFQEVQRAGLGTGRRWTSLKQHPRPPPGFEPQTEVSTPSTASPLPEPPKKSNWEVIEHFTGGSKGKGSLSSSLIAVSSIYSHGSFK